ncbi:MAG: hypothetical protein ACREJ2_12095 [Planctomycetota bacterium]
MLGGGKPFPPRAIPIKAGWFNSDHGGERFLSSSESTRQGFARLGAAAAILGVGVLYGLWLFDLASMGGPNGSDGLFVMLVIGILFSLYALRCRSVTLRMLAAGTAAALALGAVGGFAWHLCETAFFDNRYTQSYLQEVLEYGGLLVAATACLLAAIRAVRFEVLVLHRRADAADAAAEQIVSGWDTSAPSMTAGASGTSGAGGASGAGGGNEVAAASATGGTVRARPGGMQGGAERDFSTPPRRRDPHERANRRNRGQRLLVRILTVIPLAFLGGVAGLVAIISGIDRHIRPDSLMDPILPAFIVGATFGTAIYGLNSRYWTARFLSISVSAVVSALLAAIYGFMSVITLLFASGPYSGQWIFAVIAVVIGSIAGACALGAVRLCALEIQKLGAPTVRREKRDEEIAVESGSWDEARPGA